MKARTTPPAITTSADLARQAIQRSAAAMREGRLVEARHLASLAESYARIAQRIPAYDGPIDLAGEERLREDLLRRLHIIACGICEEEGVPPPPDPFSPDDEPAISCA